jgi:hypothetical protein
MDVKDAARLMREQEGVLRDAINDALEILERAGLKASDVSLRFVESHTMQSDVPRIVCTGVEIRAVI